MATIEGRCGRSPRTMNLAGFGTAGTTTPQTSHPHYYSGTCRYINGTCAPLPWTSSSPKLPLGAVLLMVALNAKAGSHHMQVKMSSPWASYSDEIASRVRTLASTTRWYVLSSRNMTSIVISKGPLFLVRMTEAMVARYTKPCGGGGVSWTECSASAVVVRLALILVRPVPCGFAFFVGLTLKQWSVPGQFDGAKEMWKFAYPLALTFASDGRASTTRAAMGNSATGSSTCIKW